MSLALIPAKEAMVVIPMERMPVHSWWVSYTRFQVGTHHLFDSADPCVFE
jgi:hypothetical protein